ncbi:MAG: ABC transporter permease [Brachymonas sp.]
MNTVAKTSINMPASRSKLLQNASFWLPACILLATLLVAWLALWWAQDPHAQNLSGNLRAPSSSHLLGADHLGRDLLARLMEALRVSFGLAITAASFALLLGTTIGLLAAWRSGITERACSLLADAVSSVPALLWVVLVAALAPSEKWALYSGLVLTAWVEFYRFVRPQARGVLLGEPVQASRLLGFGSWYVLSHHVWPPISSSLLTLWSYAVASSVLAVAALGFIGVGIRPPTAELGLMMTEALPYYEAAPWLLGAPVVTLVGIVMLLQAVARRVNASAAGGAHA